MGFVFAALSVFCSLAIAHFLKLVRIINLRMLPVLGVNYLVAFLISFFTNSAPVPAITDLGFIPIIALVVGGIFIANLFIYSASIHTIGMGISISAMRMSLIIPIGLSLWLFHERIGISAVVGILLVFVAFVLILPKSESASSGKGFGWIFPILLFLFTGIADSSLKVYEQQFTGVLSEELFLSLIFFSAFVISIILLVVKKEFHVHVSEILYGIGVGVANLYSSFFLLLALRELPGALVFSLVNISNVLLGTVIGVLYWNDTISLKQKIGIALAATSIVLLIVR